MKVKHPILIVCADLHLSLKPPVCRADDDWREVQAGYLKQLTDLSFKLGKELWLPVVIAGDIFDRWNASPELLTFAFQHLPPVVFAVPGQHDLPNHRTDEMHRSGYGVLVEAKRIIDLDEYVDPNHHYSLHGFGWGKDIKPFLDDKHPHKCVHIAVVHKYIWTVEHAYPGAPEDAHAGMFMPKLKGYDVAVFGDNHKGFSMKLKTGTQLLNCGGFMRRRSDEIDSHPQVGVIYDDGSVETVKLNIACDRFKAPEEMIRVMDVDMRAFADQLEQLGEHGLDFREIVKRSLPSMDLPAPVRELVERSLESAGR
jgi:hypothetical protein